MLEHIITEAEGGINSFKDQLNAAKLDLKTKRENVNKHRKERGPRESYQGEDYNGVSCHNILTYVSEIKENLKNVLLSKKKLATPDEVPIKNVNNIGQLLSLIDGAMASLMLVHPSEEEMARVR
jgi:hypothetical protein